MGLFAFRAPLAFTPHSLDTLSFFLFLFFLCFSRTFTFLGCNNTVFLLLNWLLDLPACGRMHFAGVCPSLLWFWYQHGSTSYAPMFKRCFRTSFCGVAPCTLLPCAPRVSSFVFACHHFCSGTFLSSCYVFGILRGLGSNRRNCSSVAAPYSGFGAAPPLDSTETNNVGNVQSPLAEVLVNVNNVVEN